VPVTEFPDTIGVSLTNIVGSADPAAMLKATAALRPMLDTSNEACMRE
jgi:multiple sugar transport system substrate-binding protein